MIEAIVFGVPAPQGSKGPFGAEANKRTKPWRQQVAQVFGEKMGDRDLMRGPLWVIATFAFPRPKSHFRTGRNSDQLRDDAPYWHTSPNDLDKLQRAVGDALTGVVWADDKQICMWQATKVYDDRAYACIAVHDAPPARIG